MKLWLLRPVEPCKWDHIMDANFGFVVRARNEREARELAERCVADEGRWCVGRGVWTDPDLTMCVQLSNSGDPGVIVQDFLAA